MAALADRSMRKPRMTAMRASTDTTAIAGTDIGHGVFVPAETVAERSGSKIPPAAGDASAAGGFEAVLAIVA